jgi:FlaG/FlaF family flagellin (archaellin)
VEGRKYRALLEDCQAVSEVVGQVLMIAIVVLAFSSIAAVIFSDIAVNPPHTPHIDLSEKIDTNDDTIKIIHIGGEPTDLKAIKIILTINEQQIPPFNISDTGVNVFNSSGFVSTNVAFMLGDYIVVNTSQKGIDLKHDDTIDMYFVDTESNQVIQRVTLLNGK